MYAFYMCMYINITLVSFRKKHLKFKPLVGDKLFFRHILYIHNIIIENVHLLRDQDNITRMRSFSELMRSFVVYIFFRFMGYDRHNETKRQCYYRVCRTYSDRLNNWPSTQSTYITHFNLEEHFQAIYTVLSSNEFSKLLNTYYSLIFSALIPARYILATLGSIGMAIVYGLKVNLSVAMVAMLNHTAIKQGNDSPLKIPLNSSFFTDITSTSLKPDLISSIDSCSESSAYETIEVIYYLKKKHVKID